MKRRQGISGGFTYVGLLMFLAILGIAATASVTLGGLVERKSAEDELLRIGAEYRRALQSYANSGGNRYPPSLQELLKDSRFPATRRHLRQLYADPVTGRDEWGLITAPEGGIVGIYSLSTSQPIKVQGFDAEFADFSEAKTYRDWIFSAEFTLKPAKIQQRGMSLEPDR